MASSATCDRDSTMAVSARNRLKSARMMPTAPASARAARRARCLAADGGTAGGAAVQGAVPAAAGGCGPRRAGVAWTAASARPAGGARGRRTLLASGTGADGCMGGGEPCTGSAATAAAVGCGGDGTRRCPPASLSGCTTSVSGRRARVSSRGTGRSIQAGLATPSTACETAADSVSSRALALQSYARGGAAGENGAGAMLELSRSGRTRVASVNGVRRGAGTSASS